MTRRERPTKQSALVLALLLAITTTSSVYAQDFDRYRPQSLRPSPAPRKIERERLPAVDGSDKVLVETLDAVIVLDDADKVDPKEAHEDASGLSYDFDAAKSLVYSRGFRSIVDRYLGGEITLRNLNQMSRDLILYYRKKGQPVVDIVIPEQKITAGTVQIVVIESRIGRVRIEGACYFDNCDFVPWVGCTRRGTRIYESAIANDLFWLNQNPFARVGVDLRPGEAEGTTDVVFEVNDVQPVNTYFGYEDTGVPALGLERLYSGLIWGNAFGRGGLLSYQYTGDAEFYRLHAHAVNYLEPLNRDWSFLAFGSWAGVAPEAGPFIDQDGESWQAGVGLIRYLTKNRHEETSLSAGFDFKTTNNTLEFGGLNVFDGEADLVQLRLGWQTLRRYCCDEYLTASIDTFIGPGEGFSSNHNAASFATIRPGTSPDYFYLRGRFERLKKVHKDWELIVRGRGQAASERLLFSETLGFGGYDSIRGYDQRSFSGDHGWILNFEVGPPRQHFCCGGKESVLRAYGLFDIGQAYTQTPLPGETSDELLTSVGVGMRLQIDQRTNLRFDYAYGFNDTEFVDGGNRVHVGLVSNFGPRP